MARTAAPKNVKLSNIQIIGTDKFYPADFVELMSMSGQEDQTHWPMIFTAMSLQTEMRSKNAADKLKKRKDRLAARAENVKEILTKLGLTLPEGVVIRSLETKERGPSVPVLDPETGKETGEKEMDITHYDIDLRWGVKGNSRLLRGSVSTGGKKEPKSDEAIDNEIEDLKEELVTSLLKLVG